MNSEQTALMAAAGVASALVLLVVCAILWRRIGRLTARVDRLEEGPGAAATPGPPDVTDPAAYVITGLAADKDEAIVPARIDAPVFADIVVRESAIKAAALAHGLRRALSAETRNRIRFEMKREVKRSRKHRRADLKAALRDFQARERAKFVDQQDGEDAA